MASPQFAAYTVSATCVDLVPRRIEQWSVDDETTAALMEAFFGELTAAATKREQVSHARALQRAQLEVRRMGAWAAPHFWAPFVLLGQPD